MAEMEDNIISKFSDSLSPVLFPPHRSQSSIREAELVEYVDNINGFTRHLLIQLWGAG
jgi:hypothetical protein